MDNESPDPFKVTFHVIFCKINQDILGRQGQSIGTVMDQFPKQSLRGDPCASELLRACSQEKPRGEWGKGTGQKKER